MTLMHDLPPRPRQVEDRIGVTILPCPPNTVVYTSNREHEPVFALRSQGDAMWAYTAGGWLRLLSPRSGKPQYPHLALGLVP